MDLLLASERAVRSLFARGLGQVFPAHSPDLNKAPPAPAYHWDMRDHNRHGRLPAGAIPVGSRQFGLAHLVVNVYMEFHA